MVPHLVAMTVHNLVIVTAPRLYSYWACPKESATDNPKGGVKVSHWAVGLEIKMVGRLDVMMARLREVGMACHWAIMMARLMAGVMARLMASY